MIPLRRQRIVTRHVPIYFQSLSILQCNPQNLTTGQTPVKRVCHGICLELNGRPPKNIFLGLGPFLYFLFHNQILRFGNGTTTNCSWSLTDDEACLFFNLKSLEISREIQVEDASLKSSEVLPSPLSWPGMLSIQNVFPEVCEVYNRAITCAVSMFNCALKGTCVL